MSLRSSLRRVSGLGSARGGTSHWYAQRVSAVALAALGVWFVVAVASLGDASHGRVLEWLASPWSSALAVLLVLTAGYHAVLGLQVVIEDYVRNHAVRIGLLVAVKFAFAVAVVIGILAVLRIAVGGAA